MGLLDNLIRVDVVNPRNMGYDIEVTDVENSTFTITRQAFDKLALSVNGLTQYIDPKNLKVYIAVESGDNASFFKNSNRGDNKKKTFKNILLFETLENVFGELKNGDRFEFTPTEESSVFTLDPIKKKSEPVQEEEEQEVVNNTPSVESTPEPVKIQTEESKIEVIEDSPVTVDQVTELSVETIEEVSDIDLY